MTEGAPGGATPAEGAPAGGAAGGAGDPSAGEGTDPAPWPSGDGRRWDWLDLPLRVAGGAVALAGGAVGGVLALVTVPLRVDLGIGLIRLPVAVLLAVAGNALLLWYARVATGARWAVVLPAMSWFMVMLPALGTTAGGSRLLMPNDWVGLLTLFGGTIVLTVGVVITIAGPRARQMPPI